jgi:PTS system N-acetylglucosamine-specific IIC component
VLYALHAIATGLAMVIMHLVGVRLGFSYSAGLFDYVMNFSHAQRPLLLLPIGAAYFALYYGVFRYCIVRLNLATPGREPDDATAAQPLVTATPNSRAQDFVTALGGARNLAEVEACTTRLRLVLKDNTVIDEATLKRLGALGIIRSSAQGLQVVLGPIADQVAGEIRAALRSGTPAEAFLAALGGRGNIVDLATAAGRLLIRTAQPGSVDESALKKLGIRGIAHSAADSIQILTAGAAEDWAAPLRRLL